MLNCFLRYNQTAINHSAPFAPFKIIGGDFETCSLITTNRSSRTVIPSSSYLSYFKFLSSNDWPVFLEYFLAPRVNGSTNLNSKSCVDVENFHSVTPPAINAHICSIYPTRPQWVRIVANGVSEIIVISTPPSFQPSCFVPSNIRAPPGKYSVSSSSFPSPSPVLANGDFELPALSSKQTYQNFASGQRIGDWLVSTTSAACVIDQSNEYFGFPENPQCYVSLERNFLRRSSFWDASGNGDCSVYNHLDSSFCSISSFFPSYAHFSGFQSVVIPMGMALKTTVSSLIPSLHYQLSFAAGMSLFFPTYSGDNDSMLSLRITLKSADFTLHEHVLVTRLSGMSAFLLPPFVASASQVEISFEVLKDSCNGECNFVRLDQVVVSLYSNGDPASIIHVREFLSRVEMLSLYKSDGVGLSASFTGISFDFRYGGHGSKVYFPEALSSTSVLSISGSTNIYGSSSSLVFSESPSWPLSPSEFLSLGLLALELQPSIVSSSGSCFLKKAAKSFLVTVSNGNLVAMNILSSGSVVFDHTIVADTDFGCASSSGPAFMSTDNKLFALVGDKFVRQDGNGTAAYFCRMLGASCFSLLSSGTLLFSASPINLPIFYDEQHQVLHGMLLLKTPRWNVESSRVYSTQWICHINFTRFVRFAVHFKL